MQDNDFETLCTESNSMRSFIFDNVQDNDGNSNDDTAQTIAAVIDDEDGAGDATTTTITVAAAGDDDGNGSKVLKSRMAGWVHEWRA